MVLFLPFIENFWRSQPGHSKFYKLPRANQTNIKSDRILYALRKLLVLVPFKKISISFSFPFLLLWYLMNSWLYTCLKELQKYGCLENPKCLVMDYCKRKDVPVTFVRKDSIRSQILKLLLIIVCLPLSRAGFVFILRGSGVMMIKLCFCRFYSWYPLNQRQCLRIKKNGLYYNIHALWADCLWISELQTISW